MRHYIRHPASIPIDFEIGPRRTGREQLKDVGGGGLCFRAHARLTPGRAIHLSIPLGQPPFEADGVVVWCRSADGGFEVGVRFTGHDALFALRMVEQVCHIEQYRRDILQREGRSLSGEQAAAEWIARYAEGFPR